MSLHIQLKKGHPIMNGKDIVVHAFAIVDCYISIHDYVMSEFHTD